jgi:large repetitive protein
MIRNKRSRFAFVMMLIVALALVALPVTPAYAAACTFTSNVNPTGNWSTSGSWSKAGTGCSTYPGLFYTNDIVVISAGDTITLDVSPGASLGSVTVSGTLNVNSSGDDLPTLSSLTINSGGTVTQYRDLTVSGATNIAGTINFGSTSGTNRTMTFTGDVTLNSGAVWNETSTGAVAVFSFGGNFINNATTFTAQNNAAALHTFTGAAKTLSGTTTTTIPYVAVSGTYTNNGTLTVSAALSGTGALTNGATGTLNINGTSSVATITNGGIVNISGTGAITTGTLTNNGTLNLSGTGTITAITNGATGTLNISSTPTVPTITTLTVSAVGNTVNYNGAGNQTVKAAAYNKLILSGSGVKSLLAGTSTTGTGNNLSITGAGTPTASVAANQNLSVGTLTLGGLGTINSTWGYQPTVAPPAYKDTVHFANTNGYLTVATDTRGSQATLTAVATPSTVVYGTTSTLSSTGGSGTGTVSFAAGGTGGCSVAGTTLTVLDASLTCTVTATKAGDGNYNVATSAALPVTLQKANQATLAVVDPSPVVYGTTPTLNTTGGGGTGAVTFDVGGSTGCSVVGSTLSVTDASGTCAVTATKAGDNNYNPATSAALPVTLQRAEQATLTVLATPSTVVYGDTSVLSATGGSGTGAVTYSVGTSTGCSVVGSTLSVTNASGTCDVTATKAADNNYDAATSAALPVTLEKAEQAALAVVDPSPVVYGTTPTLSTTGGSGTGAVTYNVGASTGCSVVGSTLSVTDVGGTCAVTATKASDNNYNAATSAALPVTLQKADQATLVVVDPSPVVYGATPTLSTTGGSGTGAVTFDVGTSTGCAVIGSTLSVTDASGTCAVTATKAGDNNYNQATSAALPITLQKAEQATLTAVATPSTVVYGGTAALSTTGGSGTGAVTFDVGTSTGCSVVGSTLSVTDASGTCAVTATKAADGNYNAATSAALPVTLQQAEQATLTAVATPSTVVYGGTSALSATGGSGTGAVTFDVGTSTGCSVVGSTLSVVDASGTCAVTATKAADNNYNAATSAALPVTLQKVDQATLTAVATPSTVVYGGTSTLSTTGGSGTGAVTFDVGTSTGCSVSGSTLSVVDASGTCAVTATKAADNNHNAATSAALPVTLQKADQAALVVVDPSPVVYGATPTLSTTGGSGTGAVTFNVGTSTGCSVSGNTLSVIDVSGTCAVTATRAGDNNYNAATSAALPITLVKADTTTALASSLNPSDLGVNVTFTATVAPSSATGTVQFYADGSTLGGPVSLSGGTATASTAALLAGTHTITATYSGDTNHNGSSGLLTPDQAVGHGATTTSLASSANPSVLGESVTFTASIAPSDATGTVQFYVDGVTLGGPVNLSSGTATAGTAALTVGTHVITATYSGDANYIESNGRLVPDQVVNKIATTTSLASSANPSEFGASVTFTASVAPSGATGTVQFYVDGTTLGSPVNVSSGTATASTAALTVGTHAITATYSGDVTYAGSDGALASDQVVNQAATTTALASSANPSVYGANVTFTATVAPSAASGTVQFYADGATLGGLATVTGGTAAVSSASLVAGTHVITAAYSGDGSYAGSSGVLAPNQVVNKAATTTALASSANPSVFGASVTFTATVAPSAATGSVQFYADGALLGSAALSGGKTSVNTAALAVGTHVITATYGGAANYAGSAGSLSPNQVVSASCTAISGLGYSFTPTAPKVGQPVSFTATGSGSAPITYTWNFGHGANVVTTAATTVHSFPLTTTVKVYNVTLTAANACPPAPAGVTKPVTVVPYRIYLPLMLR